MMRMDWHRAIRHARGLALAGACATVLSACDVAQTRSPVETFGCRSDLGSYALPKTSLQLVVTQSIDAQGDTAIILGIDPIRENEGVPLCLDHLNSVLASDEISVVRRTTRTVKDGATEKSIPAPDLGGFLQLVTNKSTDYTGVILGNAARTAFILVSGAPSFAPASREDARIGNQITGVSSRVLLRLVVDPLDPKDLAYKNTLLAKHGVCLTMGRLSYDTDTLSPTGYCNAPMAAHRDLSTRTKAPEIVRKPISVRGTRAGLLYRPRVSYTGGIYVRDDPASRYPWQLAQNFEARFENLSPVVSVGVDRALFAEAKASLIFDDGDLHTVCRGKGSEVLGFIDVPLEIVRSIVALPTQVLQVKVDDFSNATAVADAEALLLQRQERLIQLLETGSLPEGSIAAPGSDGATPSLAEIQTNETEVAPDTVALNSVLTALCSGLNEGAN